jgi:hypothetical protein
MTVSDKRLVLDIGSTSESEFKELFDYYGVGEKSTPTGLKYNTYAGYHYYLITGSRDSRLLKAITPEELEVKNKHTWVNVKDLDNQLLENLSGNLASKPLVRLVRDQCIEVVWVEPNRKLKAAERRWLTVVRRWFALQD